jgi:long-chain acyl-CoA synthetase
VERKTSVTLNLATILRESTVEFPERPAVVFGETVLTYRALDGAARRFAGALAGLGVRRGQHVALLLPNVPQFTVAYFAAHVLGAPVVPLNVLLTPDEIARSLADSDAVALVAWESVLERAQAAVARVENCKTLIVARAAPGGSGEPGGVESMAALIAASEPVAEMADTMPGDTAVVLFTSGTTGRPTSRASIARSAGGHRQRLSNSGGRRADCRRRARRRPRGPRGARSTRRRRRAMARRRRSEPG